MLQLNVVDWVLVFPTAAFCNGSHVSFHHTWFGTVLGTDLHPQIPSSGFTMSQSRHRSSVTVTLSSGTKTSANYAPGG